MSGIAYSSAAAEVLAAWVAWKGHVAEVRKARDAMSARYGGRRLMVNSGGFGHGTRVVGFEVFDGEEDGLVIGDNGELRIPHRGPPYSTATPNLRRKAGKDLARELSTLDQKGPSLPGMPEWTMVGLSVLAPALFAHDDHVWALWGADITDKGSNSGQVDLGLWSVKPLSAYYAAHEAFEALGAAS